MTERLYKLALWYIGKCNKEDTTYKGYKKAIKDLDKLTFRCWGKANLLYGLDAEWENFGRYEVLDNAIQRLAEYEELGTVEELKEAREKQIPKKPKIQKTDDKALFKCPCCDNILLEEFYGVLTMRRGHIPKHCENCGQAIDKSEMEDC